MPELLPYKSDRSPRIANGRGIDGGARARRYLDDGGNGDGVSGEDIVARRHEHWAEHHMVWRQLLDSYEAGDRYRNAVYGPDRRGLPNRNLFRHKREYPDPRQQATLGGISYPPLDGLPEALRLNVGPLPGMIGSDPAAIAQDDDYELRRARTPVPEFVSETIEIHLSKIYDQEVHREGPNDLTAWWKDVDGRGTPIDDWMREIVAPLFLVLGNLDICMDHPAPEPGAIIVTQADVQEQGLGRCVASFILPQNMVWWLTDSAGRYVQCLVQELVDPAWRGAQKSEQDWNREYVRYRHWTATESTLYNHDGTEIIGDPVPHAFGRVPIVRLVDVPKHRCPHLGKSRYEGIAEIQREFYNRDSELILSDTLQAHPILQVPEEYLSSGELTFGPGYAFPKKKNPETGAYEGSEFLSPPKDPADSLRKNKDDLVNLKDRRASLTKPAGASGTKGTTVAQSGISKQLDAETGHKLLAGIARSLSRAERTLAELALLVLRGAPATPAEREQIRVVYPAKFELFSASELIDTLIKLQLAMGQAGEAPNTEREIFQAIVRQTLLGLTDQEYKELDDEMELLVQAKATLKEQSREMYSLAGGIGADTSGSTGAAPSSSGQAGGGPGQGVQVNVAPPGAAK